MNICAIDRMGRHDCSLESLLFEKRQIFLTGEITDAMGMDIVQQLIYLGNNCLPIIIYINSPGGSVTAGLAILDEIAKRQKEGIVVSTIALGSAASMAAVILASGTYGHRSVGSHAEIMIHQVLGGVTGQAADIEIRAAHIRNVKDHINGLLAALTGKSSIQIQKDTERDHYMTAQEAIDYGLADHIY